MNRKQRLLVVDWDFFFPEKTQDPEQWQLYDWGHQESSLFLGPIWTIRAEAFDYHGIPRPGMTDERFGFWDRFKIADDAMLYYADSNMYAIDQQVRFSASEFGTGTVWLYDAHHDSGYGRSIADVRRTGNVSCEDWMMGYRLFDKAALHVRYPRWKTWAFDLEHKPSISVDRAFDDGKANKTRFDTVFVCRSGAWTPPWCDWDFQAFIDAAPVNDTIEIGDCQPREWDEDNVKALLIQRRQVEEQLRNAHTLPGGWPEEVSSE